jgi:membrane protease YdiL (CAAX protease family)
MSRFKQFATKHPAAFGVLVAFAVLGLSIASYALSFPLKALFPDTTSGQQMSEATARALLSLLFILVLWRFGWLRGAGFARLPAWKAWLVLLPAIAYEVGAAVYAYTGDLNLALPGPALTASVWFNQVTIGLLEETAFRGLVMCAMIRRWGDTKRGILKSVLLSSLIFGSLHMIWIATGKPVLPTLLQSLGAFLGGIAYGAVVLYSRSIWPAVLWHALLNAAVNVKVIGDPSYAETPSMGVWYVLSSLPVVVYGLVLLHNTPPQPVVEGEAENVRHPVAERGHLARTG